MPEWLWIIVVSGVVLSLLTYILREQLKKVRALLFWKSKVDERGGVLARNEHGTICAGVIREVSGSLRLQVQEFKEDVLKEFDGFRGWIQMYVENTVMREIRSMNNGNGHASKSIKRKPVKR